MSNLRNRRKELAKLIEAEFETIQVELDNFPELFKCNDYKSLKKLNIDALMNIRKNIQEISRNIAKLNSNIKKLHKHDFSTTETYIEPNEDIKLYFSNSVINELNLFK